MQSERGKMNKQEAQEITNKIRKARENLAELVIKAFDEKAWVPLGYTSWDDYCKTEFKSGYISIPREERVKTVAALKERGMSNRAVASSLGVSHTTVKRDLEGGTNVPPDRVTGTDGKSYPAKQDNNATKEERNKKIDENVKEHEDSYLDRGEIPPKIEVPQQNSTIFDGEAIAEEVARRDAILTFKELISDASEKLSEITDFGLLGLADEVEWMKSSIDQLSDMWVKAQSCLVETYQEEK